MNILILREKTYIYLIERVTLYILQDVQHILKSMEFKEGDLVRLKSGGPMMTVKTVNKTLKEVICEYHDEESRIIEERVFHPDTLMPADTPSIE